MRVDAPADGRGRVMIVPAQQDAAGRHALPVTADSGPTTGPVQGLTINRYAVGHQTASSTGPQELTFAGLQPGVDHELFAESLPDHPLTADDPGRASTFAYFNGSTGRSQSTWEPLPTRASVGARPS